MNDLSKKAIKHYLNLTKDNECNDLRNNLICSSFKNKILEDFDYSNVKVSKDNYINVKIKNKYYYSSFEQTKYNLCNEFQLEFNISTSPNPSSLNLVYSLIIDKVLTPEIITAISIKKHLNANINFYNTLIKTKSNKETILAFNVDYIDINKQYDKMFHTILKKENWKLESKNLINTKTNIKLDMDKELNFKNNSISTKNLKNKKQFLKNMLMGVDPIISSKILETYGK